MSSPSSDPCILVLHGPEVFDAGDVSFLIDKIRPDRVIVAGVMARTAAEESGIACEFISVPPSWVLKDLDGCCILANHGKTPESGRIFGEIVASRLLPRGLIHLECSDKTLYAWNRPIDREVQDIAEKTGFQVVPATVSEKGRSGERTIRGCIEGEPVYIDGIVIGHATGPEVVLKASGGTIVPVSGIAPKLHGLEKIRDRHVQRPLQGLVQERNDTEGESCLVSRAEPYRPGAFHRPLRASPLYPAHPRRLRYCQCRG